MVSEEPLTLRNEEMDRLHVIRQVLDKRLTWAQAGARIGLGERQVGRLCAQVRKSGNRGILHGLRGRPSNHQLDEELLSQALSVLHAPLWEGFGPTFAKDKLADLYGIRLGRETVRLWMVRTGVWSVHQRGERHRSWRERRPCIGLLVQMDGSDHDWFEGRGPKCVLLVLIDDATSLIQYAVFVESEDRLNVMKAVRAYLERFGRPVEFYVDMDSIYRVNKAYENEADRPETQFKRAMTELGIGVICANTPQAKGRVERGFETHQDRLVKELRLANISTMEAANEFLRDVYIPDHNRRCAVAPAEAEDGHRPLMASHRLDEILSMRETRVVCNDFTVRYENKWLQLLSQSALRIKPKEKVEVERRLDGSLHVRVKRRYVLFKALERKPYRPFYAFRKPKPDAWPTKTELEGRTGPGKQEWLWGWKGKGTKRYILDDEVERPSTAFI